MTYRQTNSNIVFQRVTSYPITSQHVISHLIASNPHIASHHVTSNYIASKHITSQQITSHRITSINIKSHHSTSNSYSVYCNKGFETGDGVIIVGGFFNKVARESSYAKMSLGTLPKVKVPKPNKELKIVKDFLLALRTSQQKAVYDCYSEYNAQGGRVLTLQTGSQVITHPRTV